MDDDSRRVLAFLGVTADTAPSLDAYIQSITADAVDPPRCPAVTFPDSCICPQQKIIENGLGLAMPRPAVLPALPAAPVAGEEPGLESDDDDLVPGVRPAALVAGDEAGQEQNDDEEMLGDDVASPP